MTHKLVAEMRYGIAHLKEGIWWQDERFIRAFGGQIVLLQAKDLGIEKAGDHSWALHVRNPEDPDVGIVIPGCAIRAISLQKRPPCRGDVNTGTVVFG